MPLRFLRALFVVACAGVLAACSTMGDKYEAPGLQLVGVQMLTTDMFAQRFKVRVKVTNPNDLELPIRGLEYTILMMGDSFAEGVSTEPFVLPALGEAEFDMLVTTNFVSSFGRLLSRVGGGKLENIDYEIAGKIMVDKGMLRKIPVNYRGTVDFSKHLKPIEEALVPKKPQGT